MQNSFNIVEACVEKIYKMSIIGNRVKNELIFHGFRSFCTRSVKFQKVAVDVHVVGDEAVTWENGKPYESIPGPKAFFPFFGSFWNFFKSGSNAKTNLLPLYSQMRKTYGDIVRVPSPGRSDFVFLFHPALIEKMHRHESIWPIRDGLDCFIYYQERVRPEIFQNMKGVSLLQGKEWHDMRSTVNPAMMQPRRAKMYTEPIVTIANDFLDRMRSIRDEKMEMPNDFANELNKWSLESIAFIALDTRLGCLDGNLDENSEAQKMISAAILMFETMYHLQLLTPVWKYISTPKWRTFVRAMNTITDFTFGCVKEKVKSLENEKKIGDSEPRSVLEELLKTKNPNSAFIMAMDMLTAGVDTTSNAVATTLSLLSQNPEKQEKLCEELKKYLPERNSPLTAEILDEMKYLKATIKEALRMYPVVLANTRTAPKNMVFAGYQIPKGTKLLSAHYAICNDEAFFKDPEKFIPERWLKSDTKSTTNPFAYLPFGFGPRMCIGRRFAELEIEVIVAKIIRNFKLSYHYGNMEWSCVLFTKPSKPMKFRCEDRES